MKKIYSFCFIFLMLVGINANVTQAQESETAIDEWEIFGIYKTEAGDSVAYVYPATGDRVLNIRMLSWNDLNKVGLTPPDYDDLIAFSGMTEAGGYCIECYKDPNYDGEILLDEIYHFYQNDYGTLVLKNAVPASPPYYKIADLYTQGEIEGPYEGIFCGMNDESDYVFLCIQNTPSSEKNWFNDSTTVDISHLKEGTTVRYSTQKKSFFDPVTLTSQSDTVIVDIQLKQ